MAKKSYVLVVSSEGRTFIRGFATETAAIKEAKTEITHAYEVNGAKISAAKVKAAIKQIKSGNEYTIAPNGMRLSYGEIEAIEE